MIKKIFFCTGVLITIAASQTLAQHKVQFTQYMFSGIVINPAYAGADEALSLTFMNRSQWAGVENSPVTQTLSGHTLFRKKHVGLGLTLINDKIGVHKSFSALPSYAYHLKVGDQSYLSMGIQAGVHNRKSDYASLGNPNNDPRIANAQLTNTFFDFGMGIYFRSPRLHVGLSAPELMPETVNVNDSVSIRLNKANLFFFSKYKFRISEQMNLEPSVLIKYLSNVPVSFDLNMNMVYREALTFGISYRKSESLDFLLKAQITPQLQVGYAYDHTIGEVSRLSNGSHELMVNYVFRFVHKNISSPR